MHFKWLNLWAERTLCPDFSGREIHYWPGNLPRRRTVSTWRGVGVYVRCYRLFSSFLGTQRAIPVVSLLISFLRLPSRSPAIVSSRLRRPASSRKGTPWNVRRTCVKSPRVCCFHKLQCRCQRARGRNLKNKIRARARAHARTCSRENVFDESRRRTK